VPKDSSPARGKVLRTTIAAVGQVGGDGPITSSPSCGFVADRLLKVGENIKSDPRFNDVTESVGAFKPPLDFMSRFVVPPKLKQFIADVASRDSLRS
jgi:hypothetical protein